MAWRSCWYTRWRSEGRGEEGAGRAAEADAEPDAEPDNGADTGANTGAATEADADADADAAADAWGGKAQCKMVQAALTGSCEALFHQSQHANFWLDLAHGSLIEKLLHVAGQPGDRKDCRLSPLNFFPLHEIT